MDGARAAPDTTAAPSNKRRHVERSGVGAAQPPRDADDGVGESDGESDDGCNAGNGADASCCPVCLESEGQLLQRGCCCRGDSGVVHLKCMVQVATHAASVQAWWCCGTCKQNFTGAVQIGLARAWWVTVATNDEGDADRLADAGNLAHTYSQQGLASTPRRQTLQVAALAVQKRVLGEEHPNTLTAADNLAHTHSQQGKHAEAETLQVATLAVQKRVLGEEHPDTLTSAGNLAATYSRQGKHAEAETLQVATLAVAKRVLGEEHPSTLLFAHNLALTYSRQGKHAEAYAVHVAVLAAKKRVLGEEHPSTLVRQQPCSRVQQAGHARRGGGAAGGGACSSQAGIG